MAGVNRYVEIMLPSPEPPEPAETSEARETSATRWARLTTSPIPLYCYVPGQAPHPRRDKGGHSYGRPEPRARRADPAEWRRDEVYLTGVDLFNLGFYWESHEAFEALWRAASGPPERDFFQGVIQLAAASLKHRMGAERAARALAERALARLGGVPSPYRGLDVAALRARAQRFFIDGQGARPPALPLADAEDAEDAEDTGAARP